jgi:hypothetical protein
VKREFLNYDFVYFLFETLLLFTIISDNFGILKEIIVKFCHIFNMKEIDM